MDLFFKIVGYFIPPKDPEVIVCLDVLEELQKRESVLPMCFNIYRCVNHNKNISSIFCYIILCDTSDRILELDRKFKELYVYRFKTIPECIGMYADHPNHTDIEYLFRLFYRRNKNYTSYIYCRYGLLYLHEMKEEELLIKFRFLYQDGGRTLTNRKKIDQLYSQYLMAKYPKKGGYTHTSEIECTL